jgi:spore germination cell wall hydrolase CwlJ-like protein
MIELKHWVLAAVSALSNPQSSATQGVEEPPFGVVAAAPSPAAPASAPPGQAPEPAEAGEPAAALPLPRLSKSELEESVRCMALNIYHEARSESEEGRLAVAAVTLNRVASGSFPRTVCGVIQQGGKGRRGCQFSWYCDRRSNAPREGRAWDQALALSRKVLTERTADPTAGALYYHASYVKPRWSRTFAKTGRIGSHLFYKPGNA